MLIPGRRTRRLRALVSAYVMTKLLTQPIFDKRPVRAQRRRHGGFDGISGDGHPICYLAHLGWSLGRDRYVMRLAAAAKRHHHVAWPGGPCIVDYPVAGPVGFVAILKRRHQGGLLRVAEVGVVPGDALAILDQRGRGHPGIHHGGVLTADQGAERYAQYSLHVSRLKDDPT